MSFERYGLVNNPFGGDLLDPLDSSAKLEYCVTVEGFGENRPKIDEWAKAQMAKPHFFLICGAPHTGRTSIANYIADNMPRDNNQVLLKVPLKVSDDDHFGAVHKWMYELQESARRANIDFTEGLKTRFDKNIVDRAEPHKIATPYKSLLYDVIKEVKHKRRVAAIFDEVNNSRLFTFAQEVFAPADPHPDIILVVFTTKDETLRKDFSNLNPQPGPLPPIDLRHLTGEDVVSLIAQRWKQFNKTAPSPFNEETVKHIFNHRRYPIRDVMRALEYIFNKKVKGLAQGCGDWPQDHALRIEQDELLFSFIEAEGTFTQ